MHKLRNPRVLRLRACRLKAVRVFESLVSLQEVEVNFQEVVDWPSLHQLTKLQTLNIRGRESEGLEELKNLVTLRSLKILQCGGVDKLPDFGSLINLQKLELCNCYFKDVPGLSNLSSLETLLISGCYMLERVPDWQRLTRLASLEISSCRAVRGWDCTLGQVDGVSCRLDDTSVRFDLPDFQRLTGLRMVLSACNNLEDVASIGALSQLESLWCVGLPIKELPDLSSFPRLKSLKLEHCESLERLTSREPIHALSVLMLRNLQKFDNTARSL